MSGNPFAILDDQSVGRDNWRLPTFATGEERARLERAETALHVIGGCTIEVSTRAAGERDWRTIWKAPNPGTVTVTDRRLAFGCRKFDTGSTWGGFGLMGAATGLAMTAISKGRAKLRTAGHCLGGHARYQWVDAVAFTCVGNDRLGASAVGCLHVDTAEGDRRWRFSVCAVQAPATTPQVAEAVAAAVVALRLQRRDLLQAQQIDALEQVGAPSLRPARGDTAVVDLPGAWQLGQGEADTATSRVRHS